MRATTRIRARQSLLPCAAALLVLLAGAEAGATVSRPDFVVVPNAPVPELEPGQPYSIPATLLVREDLVFFGIQVGSNGGDARLQVVEESAKASVRPPDGFLAFGFVVSGVYQPDAPATLEVGLDGEWQTAPLDLGRERPAGAPQRPDYSPRQIAADTFSRPAPTPSSSRVETNHKATARSVHVTGRVIMEVVPAADTDPATIEGVDGATVKVMEPVDVLDDNTLAEVVTDVNGNFDFYFSLDGTRDIYLKVEAANGTAVNVGTGLFFSTYNQQLRFDDFAGTSIVLGDMIWTGDFNSALYITTAITRANRIFAAAGAPVDRVHVRFPDDSRGTSWYFPLGGLEGIHLRADSARNTGTIYHEYGHHFVAQRASSVSPPDYCNGVCERSNCGHCYWCAENEATAWSEGFPNWISWFLAGEHSALYGWDLPQPRSTEELEACTEPGGVETPRKTEGYVAALLQDLVDADNENDPFLDPVSADRTQFGVDLVLDVAMNRGPSTSYDFVREFHEELKVRPGILPGDVANYWSTVRNNGLAEDTVAPSAPTLISSPTHPAGVGSPNGQPTLFFSGGTDALTGVQGHYVTVTATPGAPGAGGVDFVGDSGLWPTPLAEGSWYANVRSFDGAGNLSPDWLSYGPMVIAAPQPIDLTPTVDLFWEGALVVRNSPDGTPQAVGWPALLTPGDAWANLLIRNDSPGSGVADSFVVHFELAGQVVASRTVYPGSVTPGKLIAVNNVGPFTLQGGRRALVAVIDGEREVAELDETNNTAAVDLRIEPTGILVGGTQAMPFPGWGRAGSDALGYTAENMSAVRITPGTTYTLVEVEAAVPSIIPVIRAYDPVAGVFSGLESPLGSSTSPFANFNNYLVVNRDAAPGASVDLGFTYLHPSDHGGFSLRTAAAPSMTLPPVGDLVLNYGFPADLKSAPVEIVVGAGEVGFLDITLTAEFSPANSRESVFAYWIAPGQAAVSINGHAPDLRTLRGEPGSLLLDVLAPGRYLLVLARSGYGRSESTTISGSVRLTRVPRPEIRLPQLDPIWDVGLLPSNLAAQDDTLHFPTELLGEVESTYLNFVLDNPSWFDAPISPVNLELEGEPVLQLDLGLIPAGGRIEYRSALPITMPAGRHTLAVVIDPDNQVDERLETNNIFAMQFGWSGPTLYPGQPLLRFRPPQADTYHGDVEQIFRTGTRFEGEDGPLEQITFWAPNCDGLRLDAGQLKQAGGRWIGAAVLPEDGAIEVRLHDAAVPVAEAFVHPLAAASWGNRKSGYVLAYVESGAPVFDVGIVNAGTTSDYVAQAAVGVDLGVPVIGPTYGPYTMNPGEILALYEFDLAPGSYGIGLVNLSQTASVGVSVHAPLGADQQPYHDKNDLLVGIPNGWASPPGENDIAYVDVPEGAGGRYCVAVWKENSADRDLSVPYQLLVLGQPSAPAPVVVDGALDDIAYGAPLAVQGIGTAFGDNGDGSFDAADGSELDAAYGLIQDGWLYLLLTGNLESNGNDLEIFLDTRAGGQNRLRGDNSDVAFGALARMGDDGSGNGLTFDAGFAADWYLTVSGQFGGMTNDTAPYLMDVHLAELPTGGGGQGRLLGAATAGAGGLLFGPSPEVDNPWLARAAILNSNVAGVPAGTGAADGSTAVTGLELAIPLAAIGDAPGCIQVCAFVNGRQHDFVSNQVLGPLPVGTGNLGEPRAVDFGALAGNQYFNLCPAGPSEVPVDLPAAGGTVATLHLPAPTPFNPQTRISFSLTRTAAVELTVFDAAGRTIRRLVSGESLPGGRHTVTWLGRDDAGRRVSSGVYFVQLSAAGARQVQRVVLLK